MPFFIVTALISLALVLSGQIADEAKTLGELNPDSTPRVEQVKEWLEDGKEMVKPSVTPAVTPVATLVEEAQKVAAFNTSSEKEMPTTIPQKAIDNSPALEELPSPTPSATPEVIPVATPKNMPPPCGPDFDRGKNPGTMPCIF